MLTAQQCWQLVQTNYQMMTHVQDCGVIVIGDTVAGFVNGLNQPPLVFEWPRSPYRFPGLPTEQAQGVCWECGRSVVVAFYDHQWILGEVDPVVEKIFRFITAHQRIGLTAEQRVHNRLAILGEDANLRLYDPPGRRVAPWN